MKALDGITADIYEGEFLSIMGPSGSGKSTFFNMIGGLDRPTGGKIYMNGEDISKLSERQQAFLRCHNIGYIFQTFNLIPVMSALRERLAPPHFLRHAHRGRRGQGRRDAGVRRTGRTRPPPPLRAFRRPAAARGRGPRPRQ